MSSLRFPTSRAFWLTMAGAFLAVAIACLAGWSLGRRGREPRRSAEQAIVPGAPRRVAPGDGRPMQGPAESLLRAGIRELEQDVAGERARSAAGSPILTRAERREWLQAIYLAGPEERAAALARLGLAPTSADYEQLLDAWGRDVNWQDRGKAAQANALLREWLANDAAAVFAYVEAHADQPFGNQLVGWLRDALPSLDAERVLDLALNSLAGERRDAILSPLAARIAETDTERALEIFKRIGAESYRREAVNRLAHVLAANDSAAALEWAATLPEAEFRDSILSAVAYQMVKQDPLQALELALDIAGESSYLGALSSVVRDWSGANFASAAAFVDGLPAGRYRDAGQVELILRLIDTREIENGWARALTIGDPGVRENMMINVAANSVVVRPELTDRLVEQAARMLGESAYERLLERVDERRRLSK